MTGKGYLPVLVGLSPNAYRVDFLEIAAMISSHFYTLANIEKMITQSN